MNQSNLFKKSLLAMTVAMLSSQVGASGFQLNEHSSSGLGRAFSGDGAIADNAAVANRNPAAMMMFDRPTLSAGVTVIDATVKINGRSPISQKSLYTKDIVPTEAVPNFHYIHPINEQWAVGGSTTSNFGLATEFSDNYPAGMLGGNTKLITGNLNFSAAYRLNEQFSFGLGVNAIYAKAKFVRHAGDLAAMLPAAIGIKASDEISRLEGHKWGYGWNAGILYELNQDNRFALTYRSKVDIDFTGDYSTTTSAGLPATIPLPPGTGGQKVKGKLKLNLPDIWEFSAYHRIAPQWALHYSVAYTGWDKFNSLHAHKMDGEQLIHKDENFSDSVRVAVGTTYYYDDQWTFRTGFAFDQSAARDNRSISIPDQDRYWFTVGSTYNLNKDTSIDAGLAYMRGSKVTFNEKMSDSSPTSPVYNFKADGHAWLYGVNLNYSF